MTTRRIFYDVKFKWITFLALLVLLLSLSSAKAVKDENDSRGGLVCLVSVGEKMHACIHNDTKSPLKFSPLMSFGNVIYLSDSDGQTESHIVEHKLGANFSYKPDFILEPEKSVVFEVGEDCKFSRSLHGLIDGLTVPGDYEVWFDVVDHIDFHAGKQRKYTSNRLKFHLGENGETAFTNDPSALEDFHKHGADVTEPVAEKVQVMLAAEVAESGPVWHLLINNHSDAPLQLWEIGTRSNIRLRAPDGSALTYGLHLKLPEDMEGGPVESVPANASVCFNSGKGEILDYIKSIMDQIADPGDYQVWVDLYDYSDAQEGDYSKYSSNRLKFHLGEDGKMTFTNDSAAVTAFDKHGVEIPGLEDDNKSRVVLVWLAALLGVLVFVVIILRSRR